jgi:hypothetical protein
VPLVNAPKKRFERQHFHFFYFRLFEDNFCPKATLQVVKSAENSRFLTLYDPCQKRNFSYFCDTKTDSEVAQKNAFSKVFSDVFSSFNNASRHVNF